MTINVQWLQAVKYPAALDREFINAAMFQDGETGTRDGCLTVDSLTPSHTTGMKVKVSAGQAMVAGYLVTVDPAVTVTLDVGGAQKRTDLIVLRVYDQQEGDSSSEGAVEVVKGDPGGAVPATPDRSLVLAQAAVTATASTLNSGDLTDQRVWTTGRGGIVYMPGALDAAVPSWMEDGQAVYDGGKVGVKVGTGWKVFRREGDTLKVSEGGTGATTAAAARASLDIPHIEQIADWDSATKFGSMYYGPAGTAHSPDPGLVFAGITYGLNTATTQSVWRITSATDAIEQYTRVFTGSSWGPWYRTGTSMGSTGRALVESSSASAARSVLGIPLVVTVTNWNAATEFGQMYYGGAGSSNSPDSTLTFAGMVYGSAAAKTQVLWRISASADAVEQWVRIYTGSSWGPWRQVYGDTGWQDCTLGGGITGKVYAKVLNGVVYFKGSVGAIDGTQIGVLPSGIPKPSAEVARLIHFRVISSQPNPVRVRVDTSGRLWVHGDDTTYSFEGVSYAVPS